MSAFMFMVLSFSATSLEAGLITHHLKNLRSYSWETYCTEWVYFGGYRGESLCVVGDEHFGSISVACEEGVGKRM